MKTSIQELRERYRPAEIKYLLLAESPPLSQPDQFRFFYYPGKEWWDFFFRSVMVVVFPEFKTSYKKGDKGKWLDRFKEAGFFMMDAVDTPINTITEKERERVILSEIKARIAAIGNLVSKKTPIFLIKKNIFNIFYPILMEQGFNICHDEIIPFPSTGQQERFKQRFKRLLDGLGYQPISKGPEL